jgi:glycosidase
MKPTYLTYTFALLLAAICLPLIAFAPGTVRAQDAPSTATDWWTGDVFYEVFVRSFYDSDGDGIGDIPGLTERLDYLNDGDPTGGDDLGVTALWLMPITEATSYHGYDVIDYYSVESDYGTNEDFRAFIDAAHERGMRVIIDLVLNHSGVQHPWFQASRDPESEYADWYTWSDENPNFRGPDGQQVWHPLDGRFYYGVFWSGMPDLNYTNPAVTAEIYNITRFWLEDMNVDGFRLDAIKFMIEEGTAQENTASTHQWWRDYHAYVQSVKPDALLLGEVWDSTSLIAPYVGDEVDIAFEFDLAGEMVRTASFGLPSPFMNAQTTTLQYFGPGQYAAFLTNHDMDRVIGALRGDFGAARVAAALLLTNPGVPFIYYGEEIGMSGRKPDERIRTPLRWDNTSTGDFTSGTPWEAFSEDPPGTNILDQLAEPDSLLNAYRELIDARLSIPALQTGALTFVDSDESKVMAYLRYTDDQTVLVMINMDDRPVTEYALSLAAGPLADVRDVALLYGDGDGAAPEINAAGGFDAWTPIDDLPAFGIWVIELR